jgi:lysophospholipase L1-like esterase
MKNHLKNNTEKEFTGKIRLLLPKALYAVPGVEMNIYFDNVVLALNPNNYAFNVACEKGIFQAERWTFTPQPGDVGEYPLLIEVRDEAHDLVARAQSTIKIVPADTGAGRPLTCLCIGDSLTHHSHYTGHLLNLFKKTNNPDLTLIGTHNPPDAKAPENRHEGYGGWTAERFITHYTETARTGEYQFRGSPFLYPGPDGKPQLDFKQYCRETNQGKAPDIVTIFLGINDTFGATEENIADHIARMLRYYDTLIEMIHGLRKDTQIGAVLLPPPAASQDAFGANYACSASRWQAKRNQHKIVETMIAHYAGREKENLRLIPAFVNLDCRHNYPRETVPCNARTSETMTRLNNGFHPSEEGHRQIGDSIFCWIKSVLTT